MGNVSNSVGEDYSWPDRTGEGLLTRSGMLAGPVDRLSIASASTLDGVSKPVSYI